jgi:superfamily II DNA or RNA helicase
MAQLEDLIPGKQVRGILPDNTVTIISVQPRGADAVEIVYKDSEGRLGQQLLFRHAEANLDITEQELPWRFEGDGALFRLVSEAYRIRLAYLFDPLLAVHTSQIEPLPHQITAVYSEMLARQPLRYVLADDPGAGKTIMTGLLIKELMIRGDVKRCLIVVPGSLVEQWQDELDRRFDLPFEILTNDRLEAARSGNAFTEMSLCIARLDKLSRDEEAQAKLRTTEWDLVVVDEAHKLAASFFGGEVKYTKRYQLGEELAKIARHFLLLTATPHNGKEEDFQLFMALIDPDRFAGRFRNGVHSVDTSDLMRRLLKENLLKFDATPLFPERISNTINYTLSLAEDALYKAVTSYVQAEFNRAEALAHDGRKGTVGFALTILQRRLASSPEAIYQSLRRRRERLEKRSREEQQVASGETIRLAADPALPLLSDEDLADLDEQDPEIEETEEAVVDRATAAQTIAELTAEISVLAQLETQALQVRRSGADRKWEELSDLLQQEEMFDATGTRRKLVIFTEHRDTLNYLVDSIRHLLGQSEAVVVIHGGLRREERQHMQAAFTQDPTVQVLVATDAAGEGINLQRAHLMVNYDLPWNPNRLEQRFGRIHRIGQTEVCHLWNLVASETREGEVFFRLLQKLEDARKTLGGQVFDILGKMTFDDVPLRKLLIDAIRYGDRPDVRARLTTAVDGALDREQLQKLLDERALATDVLDAARVQMIREEMERAEARRLQPHFIEDFFLAAFRHLGGTVRERAPRRYEISHVPAVIRNHPRVSGTRDPVLLRYERIAFEKDLIALPDKPPAAFVTPGHPLLDATLTILLDRHRALLQRGALLVDTTDAGTEPRALFYLEHAIQDARMDDAGNRHVVSQQLQFVEIDAQGQAHLAGYAPYLDYAPLTDEDRALVLPLLEAEWLSRDQASRAVDFAVSAIVPQHMADVSGRREALIAKTRDAVHERLTQEILYWDRRAEDLKAQEQQGKPNARINSAKARQTADELEVRLSRRMQELEQELFLSAQPPKLIGGALIIPAGLLTQLRGEASDPAARETARVEQIAMAAVMAEEGRLGFAPRDVSEEKCGYDVESHDPATGHLRFIEVKGRVCDADTVTVTKNEILIGLNQPDQFILAIVLVDGDTTELSYIRQPFQHEPDFATTSVTFNLAKLLAKAETRTG